MSFLRISSYNSAHFINNNGPLPRVVAFFPTSTDYIVMKINLFVALVLLLLVGIAGFWYVTTPHSFEDCIVKNVRGSANSGRMVMHTCGKKFGVNPGKYFKKAY